MNPTADPAADRRAEPPFEALAPWDEHNRRLAAHVHPADWTNPRPHHRYHLAVVGAGTGGLVTAAIAAALGARVALIERKLMGGDCLNVGCVPSKAVIRAARAWRDAAAARERFGGPATDGEGDFAQAMERMRGIRAGIAGIDSAARFRDLGVDVFLGDATFTGSDSLEVGGQPLRFRRAVIAAGSRAAVPPIAGLAEAGYLTNETVFSLTERPRRLVVVGGGPIGCELAQAFAWFGSHVTVVESADRILPRDDPDAAELVARALRDAGVTLRAGATVTAVERRGQERVVRFDGGDGAEEAAADHVIVAVGRAPNVDGLGLDAAGVRFDPRRGVEVDDRLRTSNTRVYAVGDIASKFQFTHVADAHARLVVRNALFFGRGRASELVIPWCTYTSPEVAHVGIAPDEVERRRDEIDSVTVPMAEVDRARLDGDTEGFLRVHLRGGSDTILGATLVGEHAGDLVSQITQAMVAGVGLGRLSDTVFPYPTRAEVLRKAADAWRRRRLTPLAKRAFSAFFRLTR